MKFVGTSFSGFSALNKFSDLFRIVVGNAVSNDSVEITATATNENLTDISVTMAANKSGASTSPFDTSDGSTAGTSATESGGITTSSARTITFTGLSAGSNGFNVRLKATHDGNNNNAFAVQEKDITITAVVKDSGGSTVVASSTMHTAKVTHQPTA